MDILGSLRIFNICRWIPIMMKKKNERNVMENSNDVKLNQKYKLKIQQ